MKCYRDMPCLLTYTFKPTKLLYCILLNIFHPSLFLFPFSIARVFLCCPAWPWTPISAIQVVEILRVPLFLPCHVAFYLRVNLSLWGYRGWIRGLTHATCLYPIIIILPFGISCWQRLPVSVTWGDPRDHFSLQIFHSAWSVSPGLETKRKNFGVRRWEDVWRKTT